MEYVPVICRGWGRPRMSMQRMQNMIEGGWSLLLPLSLSLSIFLLSSTSSSPSPSPFFHWCTSCREAGAPPLSKSTPGAPSLQWGGHGLETMNDILYCSVGYIGYKETTATNMWAYPSLIIQPLSGTSSANNKGAWNQRNKRIEEAFTCTPSVVESTELTRKN